jgi:ubiquitin
MSSLVNTQQPNFNKETLQTFFKLVNNFKYKQFFNDFFQSLKNLKNIFDVIIFIAESKKLIHQNINQMFFMIGIKIPDEQLSLLMEYPVETYQKLLDWYEIFTKNLTDQQQVKYRERHGETFIPMDDLLAFLKEFYSSQLFKIFVKTLTGRTIEIYISSRTTVDELHDLITDKDGIPAEQQRLIFAGKQLESKKIAGDYAITNESTINLVLRLRGGMHHEISTGIDRNVYQSIKNDFSHEIQELFEENFYE